MVKRLNGKIDRDLLVQIDTLVGWRSFLAHQYLTSRLFERSSTSVQLDLETAAELFQLQRAFARGSWRITAEKHKIVATWNADPPRPKRHVATNWQARR